MDEKDRRLYNASNDPERERLADEESDRDLAEFFGTEIGQGLAHELEKDREDEE